MIGNTRSKQNQGRISFMYFRKLLRAAASDRGPSKNIFLPRKTRFSLEIGTNDQVFETTIKVFCTI